MFDELEALTILDILRKDETGKTPLCNLLMKKYREIIPTHTGGASFGTAISTLVHAGFIELYDIGGVNISGEIKNVDEWGGYDVNPHNLRNH